MDPQEDYIQSAEITALADLPSSAPAPDPTSYQTNPTNTPFSTSAEEPTFYLTTSAYLIESQVPDPSCLPRHAYLVMLTSSCLPRHTYLFQPLMCHQCLLHRAASTLQPEGHTHIHLLIRPQVSLQVFLRQVQLQDQLANQLNVSTKPQRCLGGLQVEPPPLS